jgi:hypothetical protein
VNGILIGVLAIFQACAASAAKSRVDANFGGG